ncbi:MAG: CoA-binding protein [Fibrobacteres bacterium]|nr:CoA-binding protein [Fibrobacterota bacterium]
MNVVVLGASDKTDRYSYKAVKMLADKGHKPLPIHPVLKNIEGLPVYARIQEITEPIHTITIYVSAENSIKMSSDLLVSGATRVIFNPGSENPVLAAQLQKKGIEVLEACTLVMLSTGQF